MFRGARRGERTVAAAAKMRLSDNMSCSIAVLANQGLTTRVETAGNGGSLLKTLFLAAYRLPPPAPGSTIRTLRI